MKKWMSAVCVLMAVLFMTGCGKDKSFDPSVSSLYIEKNGEITQADRGKLCSSIIVSMSFSHGTEWQVDV